MQIIFWTGEGGSDFTKAAGAGKAEHYLFKIEIIHQFKIKEELSGWIEKLNSSEKVNSTTI